MNTHESRTVSRRSSLSRRLVDRRQIPYPFGSREWVANIKHGYLAWPKSDRRDDIRRAKERRMSDRRVAQLSEQRRSTQKYSRILLTQDERKLIESLYSDEAEKQV